MFPFLLLLFPFLLLLCGKLCPFFLQLFLQSLLLFPFLLLLCPFFHQYLLQSLYLQQHNSVKSLRHEDLNQQNCLLYEVQQYLRVIHRPRVTACADTAECRPTVMSWMYQEFLPYRIDPKQQAEKATESVSQTMVLHQRNFYIYPPSRAPQPTGYPPSPPFMVSIDSLGLECLLSAPALN